MLPCHYTRPRLRPARSEAATSNFKIATAGRKFNCELRLGCVWREGQKGVLCQEQEWEGCCDVSCQVLCKHSTKMSLHFGQRRAQIKFQYGKNCVWQRKLKHLRCG